MSSLIQNTYSFISGKNWKLSLGEIISYLQHRGFAFEVSEFSRSFFTLKTQVALDANLINDLGGTLKIAEIIAFVSTEKVLDAFQKGNKQIKEQIKFELPLDILAEDIPRSASGKSVYGVSVYWADPTFRPVVKTVQRFLGSAIKQELKNQGKKARFMGFPKDRENPQLTPIEVLKQGLVENRSEFLFCMGKNETSISTTISVHNPFEFQKRDIDKPVQRKIFGISPRIARIMVNLCGCKPGVVFLDPFCGVGNILQEALLAKAEVIGLDLNKWCVEASKSNLDWIKHEYSLKNAIYSVVQGDARAIRQKIRDEIDCVATEPDLGPALLEIPTTPYAEKILQKLMPLFDDFLNEVFEVLKDNALLVLVTPFIKTRSGNPVTMNVVSMAEKVGFVSVKPFKNVAFVGAAENFPLRDLTSIIEVDERHKIGREINIFQKQK